MTHQVNKKLPDLRRFQCFLLLVKLIKINSRISGEIKRVVELPKQKANKTVVELPNGSRIKK